MTGFVGLAIWTGYGGLFTSTLRTYGRSRSAYFGSNYMPAWSTRGEPFSLSVSSNPQLHLFEHQHIQHIRRERTTGNTYIGSDRSPDNRNPTRHYYLTQLAPMPLRGLHPITHIKRNSLEMRENATIVQKLIHVADTDPIMEHDVSKKIGWPPKKIGRHFHGHT